MHKQPPHLLLMSWSHQIGGRLPSYIYKQTALSPVKGNLPEGLMQKKKKNEDRPEFMESVRSLIIMDRSITKKKKIFFFEMGTGTHIGIWSCDFYHWGQWFSTEVYSVPFKHPRKLDSVWRHVWLSQLDGECYWCPENKLLTISWCTVCQPPHKKELSSPKCEYYLT